MSRRILIGACCWVLVAIPGGPVSCTHKEGKGGAESTEVPSPTAGPADVGQAPSPTIQPEPGGEPEVRPFSQPTPVAPHAATVAPPPGGAERSSGGREGTLRVLLPFSGSKVGQDLKTVQSYILTLPLSFDEVSRHATVVSVLVNRDSSSISMQPEGAIQAKMERGILGGKTVVTMTGLSINGRWAGIAGYDRSFSSMRDVPAGRHILMWNYEVKLDPDTVVELDALSGRVRTLETRKTKKIPSSAPPPAKLINRLATFENLSDMRRNIVLRKNIQGFDDEVTDVVVEDDYLYLVTGTSGTLEIFDVSGLETVRRTSSFGGRRHPPSPKKGSRLWNSKFERLRVVDGYVYVLNSGFGVKEDLLAIDVSDKTNPAMVATYDTGGNPADLEVAGDRLYVVTSESFQILDISDRKKLKRVGGLRFRKEPCESVYCETFDLEISGNHAFIAASRDGVIILDVSDHRTIREVSRLKTDNVVPALSAAHGKLFLSEATTKADTASRIRVYNIEVPDSLRWVGDILLGKGESAYRLLASEKRLYVANVSFSWTSFLPIQGVKVDLLKVYDIGDISKPRLVKAYTPTVTCSATSLFHDKRFLYLGMNLGQGLVILEEAM